MEYKSFEKGSLLALRLSVWTAKLKIPKSMQLKDSDADADYLASWKQLVDRDIIQPIRTIAGRARGVVARKYSLPFPLEGVNFIPNSKMETVERELAELQEQFDEKVDEFVMVYPQARERAKERLKDLFNESDYPSDPRDKFRFSWVWVSVAVPDTVANKKREIARFNNMMEEFRAKSMVHLRGKFKEMVDRLAEKMVSEKKRFHSTTVDKLVEFAQEFDAYNIHEDSDLERQVRAVEDVLRGKSAEALRDDADLRVSVGEAMQRVQDGLEEMTAPQFERRIEIDDW